MSIAVNNLVKETSQTEPNRPRQITYKANYNNSFERNPQYDSFDKNNTAKTIGIAAGILAAAAAVIAGICYHKGKPAEGIEKSFKDTMKDGWEKLWKKGEAAAGSPKPAEAPKPAETPKPEEIKVDKPAAEAPKPEETPKPEEIKVDKPAAEAPKAEETAGKEAVQFNRADYPRKYTITENGQTLAVEESILKTNENGDELLVKVFNDSDGKTVRKEFSQVGDPNKTNFINYYKDGKFEKRISFEADGKTPSYESYPDGSMANYNPDGTLGEKILPKPPQKMPEGFKPKSQYSITENGQTLTVEETILQISESGDELLVKVFNDSSGETVRKEFSQIGDPNTINFINYYKDGKLEKRISFKSDGKTPLCEMYSDGSTAYYNPDGTLGEKILPEPPKRLG